MSVDNEFVQSLAKELKKIGTTRAVGDQWVSVHGIVPKGGIPYCGQEVSRTTYAALWQWVNDNNLVVSESDWQSAYASDSGNVSKYSSGDGSTTFRMPSIKGYVKCAGTLGEAGSYTEEGLPNISGTLGASRTMHSYSGTAIPITAPFASEKLSGTTVIGSSSSSADTYKYTFDASLSNEIYGNSSHVTPETMNVLFGVYAFGEVTNPGEADIGLIAGQFPVLEAKVLGFGDRVEVVEKKVKESTAYTASMQKDSNFTTNAISGTLDEVNSSGSGNISSTTYTFSTIPGIAAGQYTLQTILQRLVNASHTHKTAKGTVSKNCNCDCDCNCQCDD